MRKQRPYKAIVISHFREHSSIYLVSSVLLLMGVIFGAIVVQRVNPIQKEDLFFYLSRFFGEVSEGTYAHSTDMFKQSLLHNLKYVGLLWILGISIIGLLI